MNGGTKPEANGNTLLSVDDLADLAGVSKTSIRREIRVGNLPAVHVGRLVRVRMSDWQAYLESHRIQGKPMSVPARKPVAISDGGRPPRAA